MDLPTLGKVDQEFFNKVIFKRLGSKKPEILVGPGHGRDNAIVRIGEGRVMAITSDPISIIPRLGLEDSAWLSIHLIASDITTSGFSPSFIMVNFNLPPELTAKEFEIYWKTLHKECKKLGIGVLGGHTGRYIGSNYTIIGSGTMIALGLENKYISSNMAEVGDKVIVTKGAAIAATGLLSRIFPKTIKETFGNRFLKKSQEYLHKFSTVNDALSASSIGVREKGVSAMHDATEGGVLSALYEIAYASNVGIRVIKKSIPISNETTKICKLFKLDPYISLGEGALILSVRSNKANKIVQILEQKGIKSKIVGEITHKNFTIIENGQEKDLIYPKIDPYWKAYNDAIGKGWE
jgi:hydrogenase maturation factor